MENNVTLQLSEQEVQIVLSGLAKFPFEQVAQIINKIAAQVQPQLSTKEKKEEAPKVANTKKKG